MGSLGVVDRDSWAHVAQPGELGWWTQKYDAQGFRPGQERQPLEAHTEGLWRHHGFDPEQFRGHVLIDLGCGPSVHGVWFQGLKQLIAIDPLASEYRQNVAWNRLGQAQEVHARPAEDMIPTLKGTANAVVSINALDHGYNLPESVRNLAAYLKPRGVAFLSFDIHARGDDLHQMALTPEYCEQVFKDAGLCIEKHTTGLDGWADTPDRPRKAYGGGLAHSWWLRKPDGGLPAAEYRAILAKLLPEKGRLLEIGAYDGAGDSLTSDLIKSGWGAVLVEPSPVNFSRLMANCYRDDLKLVCAMVLPESGLQTFHQCRNNPQLSTTRPEWTHGFAPKAVFRPIYVPAVTPLQLLGQFGTDFDLLLIDTEGVTLPVLQAFPLSALPQLKAICLEMPEHWATKVLGPAWKVAHADPVNVIMVRS